MARLSIKVSGTDEWDAVSAALGEAKDSIPRDVSDLIRQKAAEIGEACRAAILAEPVHGRKQTGLRARIAASVSVDDIDGGASISSSLDGQLTNLPYDTDSGSWSHPVFGTHTWVTQLDEPGWFTDTVNEMSDAIDPGPILDDAIDKIASA